MKTLALVPMRRGSKGLPGKNVRAFHGRPLFAWAVSIGRATCSETYVTTEDVDMASLAALYGAKVILRPEELARDETPMFPVVKHACEAIGGDWEVLVLLQPTSPWRTEDHVKAALKLLGDEQADSVVSVVQIPEKYSPRLALRVNHPMLPKPQLEPYMDPGDVYESGTYTRVLRPKHGLDAMPKRRQDTEPAYVRDGTVYVVRREVIEAGSLYGKDARAIVIPSHESVNLDTEDDWTRAMGIAR